MVQVDDEYFIGDNIKIEDLIFKEDSIFTLADS
jgi:hypothetical protein